MGSLKQLEKYISKYEKEHSHMGIITLDMNDVHNWIAKIRKYIRTEIKKKAVSINETAFIFSKSMLTLE